MALQDPVRSSVFTKFEALLGTEGAAAVMAQFPTHEIADVVTVDRLDARLLETEARAEVRFTRIDARFARIDEQFTRIDERFARVDEQFMKIDDRFGKIDDRFTRVDERLERLGESIHGVDRSVVSLEARIAGLPAELNKMFLSWMIPIMLTVVGLCLTAAAFFG